MIQVPIQTPGRIRYLLQISDIHFGALKSQEPYEHAFQELQKFIQEMPPSQKEETLLLITGDFFHHHAREHAETYEAAIQSLQKVTDLLPTLMIRGNHDIDIHAPTRVDAVRAAYAAATNAEANETSPYIMYGPRMALLLQSGTFQVKNLTFGHLDVLDATPARGPEALPEGPEIALCHASLRHSKFFASEAYDDCFLSLDVFEKKGYKYVILGDIHRRQMLPSPNSKIIAAYPGSLIQLSYGEDIEEHGFAIWDLDTNTVKFHNLETIHPRVNLYVTKGTYDIYYKRWAAPTKKLPLPEFPVSMRPCIKIHYPPEVPSDTMQEIRKKIRKQYPNLLELSQQIQVPHANPSAKTAADSTATLPTSTTAAKIPTFVEHYKQQHPENATDAIENPTTLFTQDDLQQLEAIEKNTAIKTQKDLVKKLLEFTRNPSRAHDPKASRKKYVRFCKLHWSNLACFAENNTLDLTAKGIHCLLGPVYSGKSSVLDILALALFRRPIRQQDGTRSNSNHFLYYLRKGATSLSVSLEFEVDGQLYEVTRKMITGGRTTAPKETLVSLCDGKKTPIATTAKEIDAWVTEHIGTLNDMLSSVLMSQKNSNNFLHLTSQQQLETIQEWLSMDHLVSLHEYYALAQKFFENQHNDQRAKEQQLLVLQAQLEAQPASTPPSIPKEEATAQLQALHAEHGHLTQLEREFSRLKEIKAASPPASAPSPAASAPTEEEYIQYHKISGRLSITREQLSKTKSELVKLQKEKPTQEPPADFDPVRTESGLLEALKTLKKSYPSVQATREDYIAYQKKLPDPKKFTSVKAAEDLLQALKSAQKTSIALPLPASNPTCIHALTAAPTTTHAERKRWFDRRKPPTHPALATLSAAMQTLAALERDIYNPECEKCRTRMKTANAPATHTHSTPKLTMEEAQSAVEFWERDAFYQKEQEVAEAELLSIASKALGGDATAKSTTTTSLESWIRDTLQTEQQAAFWKRHHEELWPAQDEWQTKYDGLTSELEQARRFTAVYHAVQKRKDLYKQYTALKAQVEDDEEALASLTQTLGTYKQALMVKLAERPLAHVAKEMDHYQAILNAHTSCEQQLQQTTKLHETYAAQIKQLRQQKTLYKNKAAQADHLAEYFARDNPKGYFRDVLQHFLPQLAVSVNECLQQIDPLQIEITAETAHSQSTTLGLQIMLHDPEKNIKVPRSMWSGHQEFIIGLSFRIALSRFISQTQFDHLIIDEGWTASDEAHLENLQPIFALLRTRFYNTVLITHLRPVANQADHFMKIEREGPWSSLL